MHYSIKEVQPYYFPLTDRETNLKGLIWQGHITMTYQSLLFLQLCSDPETLTMAVH